MLERFGGPGSGISTKSSDTDLVSDADRDAERTIKEMLAAERPGDGLLAEEGARSDSESGRRWVVDPLDGTVNYLYGIPQWGVSVALEDGDGARVGVLLDPLHGETFSAVRGGGAFLNGEAVSVSGCDSLDRALVATGFSYEEERRAQQASVVARVLPKVRDIRRAGSAALDLCWLACGRHDGFYERGIKHWDWAAARLIAEEAGAAVEELPGEPAGLVAASPALLEPLLELVR